MTLGIFTAGGGSQIHTVVGLIDDHHVIGSAFQLLQYLFLFEKIQRDQSQGDVVKRVRSQFGPPPDLVKQGPVHHLQAESEAGPHLLLPLRQQRPGRRDNENAMSDATGNQLGQDQPGLNRFSQTDPVRQHQPWPAHPDGPENGNQLVGL